MMRVELNVVAIKNTALELEKRIRNRFPEAGLVDQAELLVHVQNFDDPPTVEAVNEIETLTSGLSRKIWQKVDVLIEIFPESLQAEPTVMSSHH